MTLKMKVWTLLDIALRVPPIFLMDKALKYEFRSEGVRVPLESVLEVVPDLVVNGTGESYSQPWIAKDIIEDYGFALLEILLYVQVLFMAVFIFLFNTKQLLSIYIRLVSVGIIILAYELNMDFMTYNSSLPKFSPIKQVLLVTETYISQIILALLFSLTNSVHIQQGAIILLFLIPSFSHTLSLPEQIQKITPVLSSTGCTLLLAYSMWVHGLRVCETVYRGITWCHSVVENYGLYTMIETHWINLHIPQVFQAFCIIRMVESLIQIINKDLSFSVWKIMRGLIIDGSENVIALCGMTSVIAILAEYLGYSLQKFLQVPDPRERSIGDISAMLFLLLCLQGGITNLDANERYNRICRNLCLLYTALMHFTLNILDPILISLSASRNPSINKHIRALTIAVILIITPVMILAYQWENVQESNAFLYALTSLMLELIIKVTALLIIYILFMIDTYKDGLWENLDDYVYYLKGASSLTEFLFGIYLLFNGMWVFIFESSSAIRACMMCLHAYFNIWIQGHKSWEAFLHRRSAKQKINFLQKATKAQLKKINDVCAICFQDLKTARITKCHHFFHGVCIRKWLNVQDTCPLCHTALFGSSEEAKVESIQS